MSFPLIEIQYLPPISYFSLLRGSAAIIVERNEHFLKQTFRNRCYINGANGVDRLVVPVTSKQGKTLIRDVRIDHDQKWFNRHWRALQSAYGKAPFYEYYMQDLYTILRKNHGFLYDLNLELLSLCLKWLGWNIPLCESLAYENEPSLPVKDYRNIIQAKNSAERLKYSDSTRYQQVFGSTFVPDLSIVDLVFCTGPEANAMICRPGSI